MRTRSARNAVGEKRPVAAVDDADAGAGEGAPANAPKRGRRSSAAAIPSRRGRDEEGADALPRPEDDAPAAVLAAADPAAADPFDDPDALHEGMLEIREAAMRRALAVPAANVAFGCIRHALAETAVQDFPVLVGSMRRLLTSVGEGADDSADTKMAVVDMDMRPAAVVKCLQLVRGEAPHHATSVLVAVRAAWPDANWQAIYVAVSDQADRDAVGFRNVCAPAMDERGGEEPAGAAGQVDALDAVAEGPDVGLERRADVGVERRPAAVLDARLLATEVGEHGGARARPEALHQPPHAAALVRPHEQRPRPRLAR